MKTKLIIKCESCNNTFKSIQGLRRHESRKIPCSQETNLTCNNCKKEFKYPYYLKQHLEKKIPCVKPKKIIEEESEKIKILKLKHEFEKEKIILKKNATIEIEEKKATRVLAVESSKTERKLKTAQVINNIHIDQLNTQINNFNVNLPKENVFPATDEYLDYPRNRFRILTNKQDALDMVYPNKLNNNLPVEIISKLHGKEALPEYRNLWYNSELDAFYRIENGQWVHVSEKGQIEEQVRTSLNSALNVLKEYTKYHTTLDLDDPNYYTNFGLFNGYFKEKPDDYYRDIGAKGLSYEPETTTLNSKALKPKALKPQALNSVNKKKLEYFSDEENDVYPEDPSFNYLLDAIKKI